MKAEPTYTDHRRKVGQCPACADYLWAEVTIEVSPGRLVWSDAQALPTVSVFAAPVAMRIAHECDRRVDAAAV